MISTHGAQASALSRTPTAGVAIEWQPVRPFQCSLAAAPSCTSMCRVSRSCTLFSEAGDQRSDSSWEGTPTQKAAAASGCGRRHVLAALLAPLASAAAAAAVLAPARAALADESLCGRIDAQSVRTPGSARPWAAKQVYFPEWMFGEWDVTQRFTGFRMPLGEQYVPAWALASAQASVEDGGVGSTIGYSLHFYSTLPDTFENQFKMNVGILPSDAIIADRAWNTAAVADATLGYRAVESSTYDTRAPEKQSIAFVRLSPQGARVGTEDVEIQLTNLRGGARTEGEGLVDGNTFCTSELYRQVRGPAVSEYEFITTYTRSADGHVTARQSEAVYRSAQSPQDILSFQSSGRAVAFYDYELDMVRRPPPEDAVRAVACVKTPKGYTQCL